jgi:hypothetical protein
MKFVIFEVNRDSVESLIPIILQKLHTAPVCPGRRGGQFSLGITKSCSRRAANDFRCGTTHRLKKLKLSGG